MKYLRRISERHQITIPPKILEAAGVAETSIFSIEARPGKIVLESQEIAPKDFEEKEWRQLDALVKRQTTARTHTDYRSAQEAKQHFDRLAK